MFDAWFDFQYSQYVWKDLHKSLHILNHQHNKTNVLTVPASFFSQKLIKKLTWSIVLKFSDEKIEYYVLYAKLYLNMIFYLDLDFLCTSYVIKEPRRDTNHD